MGVECNDPKPNIAKGRHNPTALPSAPPAVPAPPTWQGAAIPGLAVDTPARRTRPSKPKHPTPSLPQPANAQSNPPSCPHAPSHLHVCNHGLAGCLVQAIEDRNHHLGALSHVRPQQLLTKELHVWRMEALAGLQFTCTRVAIETVPERTCFLRRVAARARPRVQPAQHTCACVGSRALPAWAPVAAAPAASPACRLRQARTGGGNEGERRNKSMSARDAVSIRAHVSFLHPTTSIPQHPMSPPRHA